MSIPIIKVESTDGLLSKLEFENQISYGSTFRIDIVGCIFNHINKLIGVIVQIGNERYNLKIDQFIPWSKNNRVITLKSQNKPLKNRKC